MREVIETGRTVEAAIEAGCIKLGVNREDADFEIISLPKKGLLGVFGSSLAKVRVFVTQEENLQQAAKTADKPEKTEKKQPQAKKKPQQEKKQDSLQDCVP